jgi:hypothetical protein
LKQQRRILGWNFYGSALSEIVGGIKKPGTIGPAYVNTNDQF